MAEYAKKLHIKKNTNVTDIKLYSTTGEVGSNYVTLKDSDYIMYAKLGSTSDALASPLNIRKGSTTYKVLTIASIPYTKVTYTTPGTFTFTVPQGITKIKVEVAGAGGGGGFHTGGRGALKIEILTVTPGTTYSLTVGAGGEGRFEGDDGEASTFGNIISAQGGQGSQPKKDGTSYGAGGEGGRKNLVPPYFPGSPGWIYIEYGQGVE